MESTLSPVVSVKDLVKSYGRIVAVNHLNLSVEKGQIFCLLGPNGAGKTTTLEMLEGLRKPDSGSILVLGFDPWSATEVRLEIGVLPQEFTFFPKETPRESLGYYSDLFGANAQVDDILRLVELLDSASVKYENLSGGQKQKLGLGLALVNNPKVLFLDEPTTGLDPQARRAIWSVIENLRKEGKTIILTTHYLEEAERLADWIAIINQGKVIAQGAPGNLISKYGGKRKLIIKGGKELGDFIRARLPEALERDGTIQIEVDSTKKVLEIIASIEESRLSYGELVLREDTLEDVYLQLVGNPGSQS